MKSTLMLMCVLLITGCPDLHESKLQDITVKLKWVHQAQFAGNYVASQKGFYADEGISATLEPYSFEEPTIDAVIEGNAIFGITSAGDLILARSRGLPIKAFAVIYQVIPDCTYTLKSSKITSPYDFIGRTVGVQSGGGVDISYNAMMQKLGINRSLVHEIPIGYDATELLNGSVDVSTGYAINEPQQAIEAGYDVGVMMMAEYGIDTYADVLFATEDTLKNNPELVEGFLRATLKGWQYAIEHEDEAVDITLKYATERTRSHETYMLQKSVPFIHTGKSPIGWMEHEKWQQAQDLLLEQGVTEQEINIEDAYTMEFLKRVYIQQEAT